MPRVLLFGRLHGPAWGLGPRGKGGRTQPWHASLPEGLRAWPLGHASWGRSPCPQPPFPRAKPPISTFALPRTALAGLLPWWGPCSQQRGQPPTRMGTKVFAGVGGVRLAPKTGGVPKAAMAAQKPNFSKWCPNPDPSGAPGGHAQPASLKSMGLKRGGKAPKSTRNSKAAALYQGPEGRAKQEVPMPLLLSSCTPLVKVHAMMSLFTPPTPTSSSRGPAMVPVGQSLIQGLTR